MITEEIKSYVFKLLMSASFEKQITSTNIALAVRTKFNIIFSTVSVRKIINEFRREELPVLASSLGYWISYNKEEVLAQVQSMKNRIAVQIEAINGLENLVKTL